MFFFVQRVFAREHMDDFACGRRHRASLALHIVDILFANFARRERHDSLETVGADVLAGNAHVDITDIDSRRVFDYLDRLLEGFHHRVKFVRILEREIAAFHNTDIFAFRNAYEQVQLRSPDIKTEDVFFFSLFLFTVIH